jgi:hypothetical protein
MLGLPFRKSRRGELGPLRLQAKIIGDIREVEKRINLAKTGSSTKKEDSSEIVHPLVSIVILPKTRRDF